MNKVIVVGNNGEKITATTYAQLKEELLIAEQQDPDDLDLYKEVALTSVIGQDKFGHPLYKADVKLEPRVSRIEIGAFKYKAPTEGQRKYKSIEVQQVMLNNYFEKADNQTGIANTINNSTITEATVFGISRKLLKPILCGIAMYLKRQRLLQPPCLWLHWMKQHSMSILTQMGMYVLHITSFLKMMRLAVLTILRYL